MPLIQLFDGYSSDADALSSEKIYSASRVFTVHWGTGVESPSSKTVAARRREEEGKKDNYPDSRPEDGGKLLGRREERRRATLTHFMNEQKRAPGLVPTTSAYIRAARGGFPTRRFN